MKKSLQELSHSKEQNESGHPGIGELPYSGALNHSHPGIGTVGSVMPRMEEYHGRKGISLPLGEPCLRELGLEEFSFDDGSNLADKKPYSAKDQQGKELTPPCFPSDDSKESSVIRCFDTNC